MESTFVFSFLKEGFNINFPSLRFLSVLSSDVLTLYKRELFLNFSFFMAMLYHFTTITLLISPILIKPFVEDDEFRTECAQVVGMLWRWIWDNQVSSLKTMNVIATVGTKHYLTKLSWTTMYNSSRVSYVCLNFPLQKMRSQQSVRTFQAKCWAECRITECQSKKEYTGSARYYGTITLAILHWRSMIYIFEAWRLQLY